MKTDAISKINITNRTGLQYLHWFTFTIGTVFKGTHMYTGNLVHYHAYAGGRGTV